jgi:hypothetical protein
LFSGNLSPANLTASSPAVKFLQNTEVVTVYNLADNSQFGLGLYASAVDSNSCFNDAGLACQPTTSGGKPIVWKIDVPQGTTASLGANAKIAASYTSAAGGIDFGTDVFTDMAFDTTILAGPNDPARFGSPSVQSLHEVQTTFNAGNPSGCAFSSPVANTCYKSNRGTLPFTIPQCSNLSVFQFAHLGLPASTTPAGGLSLVQTFAGGAQAPFPINLNTAAGATNTKASFRYDSTKDQWQYNFAMDTLTSLGVTFPATVTGCAFDSSGLIQPFCVSFTVKKSCP